MRSNRVLLVLALFGCGGNDERAVDAFVPPDVPAPMCGDGAIDPGEDCDDGNTVDGDACPADCLARCGDGVVTAPESCDDGNEQPGDGCYRCANPGQVAWATTSCGGPIAVAPDGSLIQACFSLAATALIRLTWEGVIEEVWPRTVLSDAADPVGTIVSVVTDEAGDIYLGARVQIDGTTGTRVFGLSRDMRLKWTRLFEGGVQFWSLTARGSQVLLGVADNYRSGVPVTGQNARFVALSSEDGETRWTFRAPRGTIASVGALDEMGGAAVVSASAWNNEGDVFLRRRLHRLDADGAEVWSTLVDGVDLPDGAEGRVDVGDLTMNEGVIRLTGFRLVDDGTSTLEAVWLRELAPNGRVTTEHLLAAREHRGVRWHALRTGQPTVLFAQDRSRVFAAAYSLDPNSAAYGVAEDGSERWRVAPAPPLTRSLVELESFFCGSDSSEDVSRTTCWLTR